MRRIAAALVATLFLTAPAYAQEDSPRTWCGIQNYGVRLTATSTPEYQSLSEAYCSALESDGWSRFDPQSDFPALLACEAYGNVTIGVLYDSYYFFGPSTRTPNKNRGRANAICRTFQDSGAAMNWVTD